MYISRVHIENFRNFSELDVDLNGDIVILGENRVGKSNFLFGLRLILDASLPDSARQLTFSDFWDGIEDIPNGETITVSLEIKGFERDLDTLALLTDYRLDDDPTTVRLTYEFRPKDGLEEEPETPEDYEFVCYGGESVTKQFGHSLRRRLTMDVMPALRDAEGDLAVWRKSPLRPLLDKAFADIPKAELEEIATKIEGVASEITAFPQVDDLETEIASLFRRFSGPKQDVSPTLGFMPTETSRLYRSIRLLIDDGERGIADASLGSANLIFLSLKYLEIQNQINENVRDHTFLAIEEPEAHLHPHLQRSVYRNLFDASQGTEDVSPSTSVILTTHSPHIASVAPIRSLLLLKDQPELGTVGYSTASLKLKANDIEDISRYLDVSRAEILFARGVILVEGDAEKFLVPEFAKTIGHDLDQLGISVCSVSGTHFRPYAKFLTSLGIPFSIITDWDPSAGKDPLGRNRSFYIVSDIIKLLVSKAKAESKIKKIGDEEDYDEFCLACEEYGIFSNLDTLEKDLYADGYRKAMLLTLLDFPFGPKRKAKFEEWLDEPSEDEIDVVMAIINEVGKGRFSQRLISHIDKIKPPSYISKAIQYVVDRV